MNTQPYYPMNNYYYYQIENRAPIKGTSNEQIVAGVTGINDNNTDTAGAGVYGESRTVGIMGISKEGQGVWGETKSTHPNSTGVYAIANAGVGVWGKGGRLAGMFEGDVEVAKGRVWANNITNHPNASAVLGTSQHGVGVWGKGGRLAGMFEGDVEVAKGRVWANNITNHPNASAVLGTSQHGVGVWGKGGRLAGMFEGNVEITGNLIVSGVSYNALLARLATLESKVASIGPTPSGTTTTGRPIINAEQIRGNLKVTGSNFNPNANVRIRLIVGQIGNEANVSHQSKADKTLDTEFPVTGVASGTRIWVSATDGRPDPSDLTGFLWSNTVPITWV
ncbi:hypothetical protein [Bacillus pseudomycoides]|uniref:hypothetical protein n=1 Tax=Bacillus pseudomycoides TaxID=64104 RepID=UPI000BF3E9B0|nr:hypothetical protein [Bacillus pseudomycoides]PFW97699.1 hypothetical protein COL29_02360 [Bacillus pseudomycoides]